MKVFISMKVPREDKSLRHAADLLFETIKLAGHQPFVATDEIAQRELKDSKDFMPFVRDSLQDMDQVIWLCRQPGERVSSSLQGCADVTIEYDSLDDLHNKLFNQFTQERIGKELCETKVQGKMTGSEQPRLSIDFDQKV
jgi:hypothetical protein